MSDDQIRSITEKLEQHSVLLGRIDENLAMLKEWQCPAPGLCLEIEKKVEAIVIARAVEAGKREGIVVSSKLIYALFTSGLVTIGYELWSLFSRK